MSTKQTPFISVVPIIMKDNKILFHLRQNTSLFNGYWDFAGSGHIDNQESYEDTLVRECREELNIIVDPADAKFVHMLHYVSDDTSYIIIYFSITRYSNEPMINEPTKCAKLHWATPDECPRPIIPAHLDTLEHIRQGKCASVNVISRTPSPNAIP